MSEEQTATVAAESAALESQIGKFDEIISYKAFDKKLCCNPNGTMPFQYEIGKTYEIDGEIIACQRGFHACENPFDVFRYCIATQSRFALVKQSGQIVKHNEDSKVASARITIEAELHISEMLKRGATWLSEWLKSKIVLPQIASLPEGCISTTGDGGIGSSTGARGIGSSTGYRGIGSSAGYRGIGSSTGDGGIGSSTGDRGIGSSTGARGIGSSAGYRGIGSSTGDRGIGLSTGDGGIGSSTGDGGDAEVLGKASVAIAIGKSSRAKACGASAIVCVYRDNNGNLVHIRAAKIGGPEGIEPDVWYTLDADGHFVKAEQ